MIPSHSFVNPTPLAHADTPRDILPGGYHNLFNEYSHFPKICRTNELYVSHVVIHSNKIRANCTCECRKANIGLCDLISIPYSSHSASFRAKSCTATLPDACPDQQASDIVLVNFSDIG
ncbi:hypothetical protein TNCV_1703601 [Trichonephila clavipes]|nr:hypothetical protein TNCV_1703601 [Trichonephila clavipes]